MPERFVLPCVDEELARRIEGYSDDFWACTDRDARDGVHAYFRYPAMMVPGIQRELIGVVRELQPTITNVLDPFVGAGTTMTACMPSGLSFSGQDINPLGVLISRAKTGPFFNRAMRSKVESVLDVISADEKERVEAEFKGIDKWFTTEAQIELSKIRRGIRRERALWARRFLWVALAETVRLTSNSRTSTYKLHIRPAEEIASRRRSAVEIFREIVSHNLEDFLGFRDLLKEAGYLRGGRYVGQLSIHLQDSAVGVLPPGDGSRQFDLVVTSPPYGDNTSTVPYGQHSYLPLQWIDVNDIGVKAARGDWLRTTQEIDRRSLGGKAPEDLPGAVRQLCEKSPSYETTMRLLKDRPKDRLARVTSFSYALQKTLSPIVDSLRPNAYMIWFVGNRHVGGTEIPTAHILVELLDGKGACLVARATRAITFRRMASRNMISSAIQNEHMLIFRKVAL